ncbi:MAG: cyclodeaminase/cyclohydrolase family protein [Muribaculaceae bacterium]|nr:cyclodeaminase/cyclohydrolase family protein [Muribaculaceae bacterium]
MKLQDLTIKEFLEKTYGKDPVPGGGSVSALCGSLAASLGEMVTALTIGRKKYVDVEEEMLQYAPQMEMARRKFLDFIDEDAEAYQMVFDAFKLPKETEDEQKKRHEMIQKATLHAAMVPLRVAETAVGIMDAIFQIGSKGNRNAVTDACVAMMCARTAAWGAILNVRINLTSLDDKDKAKELENRCMALHDEAEVKEAALLDTVTF